MPGAWVGLSAVQGGDARGMIAYAGGEKGHVAGRGTLHLEFRLLPLAGVQKEPISGQSGLAGLTQKV